MRLVEEYVICDEADELPFEPSTKDVRVGIVELSRIRASGPRKSLGIDIDLDDIVQVRMTESRDL